MFRNRFGALQHRAPTRTHAVKGLVPKDRKALVSLKQSPLFAYSRGAYSRGTPMPDIRPLYTPANVTFAYQLRWAMTLFITGNRPPLDSIAAITQALETDGIRVLSQRYAEPDMLQLTLSTLPHVSPKTIAQRVKGRLWYAWQSSGDVAIEKHYALRSYGTQDRKRIEAYIAGQASHHPMATEKATNLFRDVNFIDEHVRLERPLSISHSLVWFNLHIVLVHTERWRNVNEAIIGSTQRMVRSVCKKYGWRLSRCGIVADHMHLSVGANVSDAVQDVVLKFMNNLAFVYDMKQVYQYGAYVATFGEYDQRALRRGE
jgi:REP element-mobilizing transposase RayT